MGLALLAIVDTQALRVGARAHPRPRLQPQRERPEQRGLRARSQLARAPRRSANPACSAAGAGFGDTIGSTATATAATARLRPTSTPATPTAPTAAPRPGRSTSATTSPARRSGPTRCSTTRPGTPTATTGLGSRAVDVAGQDPRARSAWSRSAAGRAERRSTALVAGNVSDDLGPVTSALTNTSVLSAVTRRPAQHQPTGRPRTSDVPGARVRRHGPALWAARPARPS